MATGRHLGLDPTGNVSNDTDHNIIQIFSIRRPENPTLEPNMKGIGDTLLSYGHLKFFTL